MSKNPINNDSFVMPVAEDIPLPSKPHVVDARKEDKKINKKAKMKDYPLQIKSSTFKAVKTLRGVRK